MSGRIGQDLFLRLPLDEDTFCGQCGYNLRTRPSVDRCPECGHEYDARPHVMRNILIEGQIDFPTGALRDVIRYALFLGILVLARGWLGGLWPWVIVVLAVVVAVHVVLFVRELIPFLRHWRLLRSAGR